MTRRWSVTRLLWLVNAVFLGLYAGFFLVHSVAALLYPYPLNYGEGAVVATALSLRLDPMLYRDPNSPPYLSANYGPLYYLPTAASRPELAFAVGRLVSVGASLAIAAGLIHLVRPPRVVGLGLAGLWLALIPVYAWSSLAKPDLLALALAFWGLLLVRTRPIGAGVLIAAAVLTKPTAGAALLVLILSAGLPSRRGGVAPVGTLSAAKKPRTRPDRLAVLMALTGLLAIGLLLNLFTDGWFVRRVFLLNLATWSSTQGIEAIVTYFRLFWPLTLAAGALALWRAGRGSLTRWELYWLVTLVGFTVGAAKLGAYINYYLDPLLASLAIVGSAGAGLSSASHTAGHGDQGDKRSGEPRPAAAASGPWDKLRLGPAGRAAPALAAGLLLIQLVLAAHIPFVAEPIPTPTPANHAAARRLVERLQRSPDPWLAEESGWLIAAGRSVWIDDPFYFAQLAAAGAWNPRPLIDRIERQEFPGILLDFDPTDRAGLGYHAERFTPAALDALRRAYSPAEQVGPLWILEPVPVGMGDGS